MYSREGIVNFNGKLEGQISTKGNLWQWKESWTLKAKRVGFFIYCSVLTVESTYFGMKTASYYH